MGATTGVIWLCACVRYWLYLGTSELVRVLQCLHWYLLKDCQSRSLKNISQFVHTLSVLSTQDKNSKNRECNTVVGNIGYTSEPRSWYVCFSAYIGIY